MKMSYKIEMEYEGRESTLVMGRFANTFIV